MTRSETTTAWIVFDRVEIDLAGRRLFVAGGDVPLEPKAFAVLALLAAHPGQAFTRDEILDAVWGHRHVTPGVLNRVMTMLRQALGESAGTSQYLHTLHGVGYRFDAQTQMLPARRVAGAPEEAGIVAAHDRGVEAGPTASPAPVLPATPAAIEGAQPAPAAAPSAAVAMPAASRASAAVRLLPWLGALLACVAIGAWFLLAGRTAPTPAGAAPTLVVLPLRPVGSAPDEGAFADGLSEELITRLARIDGLRLISRTSAALAQTEKLDLSQLAQRLRVTHALEGSLRQSGQQLRIDLRLMEIPSGRTVWAQDYDRGLADVFAIQSEIATSVAATLTLKLGLAHAPADRDPQLFRAYLQLRHRLLVHPDSADYKQLIADLRDLVARAPDYARAQGLLARVLARELRSGEPPPAAELADAARAAERALELDPEQTDAHAAAATLACRATDWTRCMSSFQRALQLAPADSIARAAYGVWLADIGHLDQALAQIDIGAASDPLNYEASLTRARVLDTMGRHAEADAEFDRTARLPSGSPARVAYARWYNAVWRGDFAAAKRYIDDMPAEHHFRESYRAATEALIDPALWPRAETAIAESERIIGSYNFLRLFQPHPDLPGNIAALEAILKDRTSSYHLLLWNPETIALRRDPAFQDFLRRTHVIDYWRSNGWPAQCKPDGDGARCD